MFWILFSLLLKENFLEIEANDDFHKQFAILSKECYSNPKNRLSGYTGIKCSLQFLGACWPETRANETASQICPKMFFVPIGNISKRCNASGMWERPDISSCHRPAHPSIENDHLRVYVGVNWFSFSIMVPSLIVTLYLLKGKNERFNVHTNLILAFTLRTITFFVHHYGELDSQTHAVTCNIFWVLNRYFAAAEITWMLNEALLLLRKVVVIFDKKSYLKYYMLVGWGSPLLLMAAYIPVMISIVKPPPKRCWTYYKDSKFMFVIYTPLIIILTINLFALIYTVSIFVKRQKGPRKSEFLKLRKAIKGTLILSPLLGLIYLLIFFQPENTPVWYDYVLVIIYPLQIMEGELDRKLTKPETMFAQLAMGTLACLIYLTFSAELLTKAKLKFNSSIRGRRSLVDNGYTWSFSRSRNSEKSPVCKREHSSPCHSVDPSYPSLSSPPCDNGPKCGCPDASLVAEKEHIFDKDTAIIPEKETACDEEHTKFLEVTTSM